MPTIKRVQHGFWLMWPRCDVFVGNILLWTIGAIALGIVAARS
jgi:hypothetical protein